MFQNFYLDNFEFEKQLYSGNNVMYQDDFEYNYEAYENNGKTTNNNQ